jgi:DNA-binding beta-propeller fold protein YncE
MKKLILFLFFLSSIFGAEIVLKKEIKLKSMYLPLILKVTAESNINNVAISNDNKQILVASDNKVKIFNYDGELIKSLKFNNVIKAFFSNDDKKIFVLTDYVFHIYDAKTYNEIAYIKRNGDYFKNLFLRENLLALIEKLCCDDEISIFNTDTNEKINSFKIHNSYYRDRYNYGDFSFNLKKIALSSYNKAAIYNLKGDLLNSIPSRGKFYEIKWIDKDNIIVRSSNNNAYVFNVKTGNSVVTINNKMDRIDLLDKEHVLVFYNDKIKIFDLKKLKFLDKIYVIKGEYQNDKIKDVYLSKDKKLLAVAYSSRNMKLFDASELLSFSNSNKKLNVSKVEQKENKETPKPVMNTPKIVENKKPQLLIYASQTEGYAPLKVYFKFLSNDEDGKVVAFYVNFLGKEFVGKGDLNKSFAYTFRRPGKYRIMVAVKDNKGAITEKKVLIDVKEKPEESFDEFKKRMLGR